MNNEQWKRLGLIGLLVLLVLAAFYLLRKSHEKKQADDIPLDDRLGS